MARRRKKDEGDPYTGNAFKDGFTCLARAAPLDEDLLRRRRDEYERTYEELGFYDGRGRMRSCDGSDDDEY